MLSRCPFPVLAVPALLVLSGCGYVHLGRLPAPTATVVGDAQLLQENSALQQEKKLLQQELALSRAQGDALRMAVANRNADGDTSKRLVEQLQASTRDLAALRANYATLRREKEEAIAAATEATALKARLNETEERLATSLRTHTELQDEIARLRSDVTRTQTENVALTEQVKTVTAHNAEMQAALAQLNGDLLAQKDARLRAEQDAATLRTELTTIAPNASALAQLRTGAAAEARSLAAEHAAETAALKQELETFRGAVQTLEKERSELRDKLAALESSAAKPRPELAHVEARLAEAMRSAAALREENEQLKRDHDAPALRTQLRAIQAQAAALAQENAQLKARLASTTAPAAEDASGSAPADAGLQAPPTGSTVVATLITKAPGSARANIVTGAKRFHLVSGGDTLAKIATHYYGTPSRWTDIFAANRDILGESNNLVVGRTLRIP